MKKTIAITSALAAASSLATAEIKINEFLSFEGFVDMSYVHSDGELDGDGETDNSFGVDQVEIDWLFNFGKVTAQVDLEYEGDNGRGDANDSDGGVEVEQAFVSYDLGNGASITAGRYESMLGLEAKEPTGLYQYSTAYSLDGEFGLPGSSSVSILPDYAQGVKYTRESNGTFFGISIQDQSFDTDSGRFGGDGNDDNDSSYGIEVAFSTELSDGLTFFLGGAYEDVENNAGDDTDTWVINSYVTYETGAWTFGAELNYGESDANGPAEAITQFGLTGEETTQGLIMANYAYSDCCSVTGRISYSEHDADGGVEADFTKYTLAHNYAVSDNLAIITEVSLVDGELAGDDAEATTGAVEVLFTF